MSNYYTKRVRTSWGLVYQVCRRAMPLTGVGDTVAWEGLTREAQRRALDEYRERERFWGRKHIESGAAR